MNRVDLMGRFTKESIVRRNNDTVVATNTLAVDRRGKDKGADFISIKAWDKLAEWMEKYANKGVKVCVSGRIETGQYVNKDNVRVYTTDVVLDSYPEFCERKADNPQETADYGFTNIPVDIEVEDLPFE